MIIIDDIYYYKVNKNIAEAVFIQFIILIMQYLVLNAFNIGNSLVETYIKYISKIIVGLFFIKSIRYVFIKEYKLIILLYIFFIMLFLANILIFPKNYIGLKSIFFNFFFVCIPSLIYSYIMDAKIAFKVFERTSNIIFMIGIFITMLKFYKNIDIGEYSMSLSYYLLIPALFNLHMWMRDNTIKNIILFIVIFFSIVILGARGPILSILVYGLIHFVNDIREQKSIKKIIFMVLSIIFSVFLVLYFNEIVILLKGKLENVGIYSRTLNVFTNNMVNLSGRDSLYDIAIKLINENPVFGIGLAGDRYYVNGYIHNLFLEIVLHFGIIIGGIICIFLVIIIFKNIFFIDTKMSNYITIFFCLGIIPLLVSNSYLIHSWFWIYIGIVMKNVNRKKSY